MQTVVFTGSFDPALQGHVDAMMWLIERGLCSNVIAVVNQNPYKEHILTRPNAAKLLELTLSDKEKEFITIQMLEGEMKRPPAGAQAIARGLREFSDFGEEVHTIKHLYKVAADEAVDPLPILWIPHFPQGPRQSSTAARNILFGLNPNKDALCEIMSEPVTEILLSARRQVVSLAQEFPKTPENLKMLNQLVAEKVGLA